MFNLLRSGALILVILFVMTLSLQAENIFNQPCSETKNVKGYKDLKMCMDVIPAKINAGCEEYSRPKSVYSIGKLFPIIS
jgi:hypothetical protein